MKRNAARSWPIRLIQDESGPTATEYAVMLALIIVVCLSAISAFGIGVRDSVFDSVNTVF